MKNFVCIVLYFLTASSVVFSQQDSSKAKVDISAYLESYYSYDFGHPSNNLRPCYLVNFNRANEFNLNLGLFQANVRHDDYRANIGLMLGSYVQANLAAEPSILRNIYEASIGLRIDKKSKLWADVGIFPSHLGTESAIGADNATASRALAAEASPYYLSGAKLTWNPSEKTSLTALIINGWQRMWMVNGNTMPSFGHQVQHKTTKGLLLNWSSFVGTEDPDTNRRWRIFNDFYAQWKPEGRFSAIAGFDIGFQQKSKSSQAIDMWISPQIVLSYQMAKRWALATRLEYFYDPQGIAISCQPVFPGIDLFGASINADFKINERLLWRIEGRMFNSQIPVFPNASSLPRATNSNLLTSLSLRI